MQEKHFNSSNETSEITREPSLARSSHDAASLLIKRINCVHHIKIFCKLTKVIQKHRGASISCINGDTNFLSLRERLEREADKLFVLLTRDTSGSCSVPQARILAALNDWQSIKLGWQKDTVILNYEFHSHLVDMLNRLVRECVKQASEGIEAPDQIAGFEAVLMEVPENIELLAKLRGLATHIAVAGYLDHDSRLRLSFLCEKITRDYKRLVHSLNAMKGPMASIQPLHALPRQKARLEVLLKQVSEGILESHGVIADPNELFNLATEIIDVNWSLVEQGLQVLEEAQFNHYLTD